MPTVDLSIIS